MIEITHIQWNKKAVGIAWHKLNQGKNEFKITVRNKLGELSYPDIYIAEREKYKKEIINKNLMGIWIPLNQLEKKGGELNV